MNFVLLAHRHGGGGGPMTLAQVLVGICILGAIAGAVFAFAWLIDRGQR